MPSVIPEAEEANTVLRKPYTRTVRSERRAMTTSMTHYQRGTHCRGRVSEKWGQPDMIGGIVTATIFNAPYQTS